MLKLDDRAALRLHVGDVLLAAWRGLNKLLPVRRKLVLPGPMPFRLGLPPMIAVTDAAMRPVPDSKVAALGDHSGSATPTCRRRAGLCFVSLSFDICEFHAHSLATSITLCMDRDTSHNDEIYLDCRNRPIIALSRRLK